MKIKKTDAEILNALLSELRYNASSFAKEFGITPSSLYHITKGSNNLSDDLCKKIVNKFPRVNYMFLKFGELPILKKETESKNQILQDSENSIKNTLISIESILIKILYRIENLK